MKDPIITIEIPKSIAKKLAGIDKEVPTGMLSGFVANIAIDGLLSVNFPESDVIVRITDD
ncbi:hypothetical protein [Xenorhabdus eapokensis]|uniref:Uncharacterized protein n=1 Tax=Xenorhabdus eapokensis TaxID=1873482 RepID=A0A1Q5TZL5_9GAMM|nr:hypothetical protein [Xenorhabdus eapokensis]OKP05663.1 hypothetical protein Xedl_00145 [Xenorhabdus eapokensis]